MYITVKQAAEKWGISDRRVRILCSEGKISGATREGRSWRIPSNAKKPEDGRFRATESLLTAIDRKKRELDTRRPLTEGELERLTEEFIIEYTYNSNAIEGNTLTLRETDMVLRGLTIDRKPLKDHMEAVGHKEAFDFVRDLVKEQVVLCQEKVQVKRGLFVESMESYSTVFCDHVFQIIQFGYHLFTEFLNPIHDVFQQITQFCSLPNQCLHVFRLHPALPPFILSIPPLSPASHSNS